MPSLRLWSAMVPVIAISSLWLGAMMSSRATVAEAALPPTLQSWQEKAKVQADASQNRQFKGCLFGDSISSELGDRIGENTANFALGGLSSVTLLQQLRILKPANIQCDRAIIAIGTNDAMNGTTDQAFVQNLKQAIAAIQAMGAPQVTLVAAFFATDEASRNPYKAGTNERVQDINALIQAVAREEQLAYVQSDLQPLFWGHTLRQDVTFDGVHLNEKGKQIYRRVILKILNFTSETAANAHSS